MNPWKAKLFLDALDERIVPDATPVVTYADGFTSGAVVATFDSGSGSGSDTTTVLIATTIIDRADLIKERDRLNALIQKNKDAITANLVKIADWNSCIKCATDYLNGLKAELSAIRTRQSATQVEWNTLVGRGYSSGPLLDALNLKLKAIDQEIVENGKATDSCNDEISRESSERGTLVQANLDLARDNAAQQIKLNAVNSLLDSQKKGA